MLAQNQQATLTGDVHKTPSLALGRPSTPAAYSGARPRVALLTPYTGGNFGDAAIQDAVIANLRLRLPNTQFSGISLDNENYLRQHGTSAFPICASGISFYGMSRTSDDPTQHAARQTTSSYSVIASLKAAIRRVPGARGLVKMIKPTLKTVRREIRHCVHGYHFLRGHDLVVVCGGGQLDEEWGGPWGHPFALLKWAVLSKLAGVPYAIASVGTCKVNSKASRLFLSAALRMARYRSYRDKNSREIAAGLYSRAAKDSVVPDLALGLPPSELPRAAGLRSMAQGRITVAISPIVYAKSGFWPTAEEGLYNRYLHQMAEMVSELLKRNIFLVFVWSARGDQNVIPELLARLDPDSQNLAARQVYFPKLANWKDLLAVLLDVDFLIGSRLHSTIFGFLAKVPLVAISFDPKVDSAMQDFGQKDSVLQIRNFAANDVLKALARLELRNKEIAQQIGTYCQQAFRVSGAQFDALAQLAMISSGNKTQSNHIAR